MSSMQQQQLTAPPHLRAVADFLRSSKAGMRIRTGVVAGKRADYFKGKSAIKALLSPAYGKVKTAPTVTNEVEAQQLLTTLIPYAFFLRVERGGPSGPKSSSPKVLQIVPQQGSPVESQHFFVWFYEGSQLTTYLGGVALVAIMLAGVMFPLWPPIMRLGVWYLSIAVLGLVGLFFAIAIVRLIFYIITVIVASPGIWIFPELFADVGFVESFIPLWAWDLPKKKGKKSKRSAEGGDAAEGGKKSKKGKGKAAEAGVGLAPAVAGASIEEVVEDAGSSGAGTPLVRQRSARVEDVSDEDD